MLIKKGKTKVLVISCAIALLLVSVFSVVPGAAFSGGSALEEFVTLPVGSYPGGLVYGPDGLLWGTGLESDSLFKIGLDTTLETVDLGNEAVRPFEVVVGSDRNPWISDQAAGLIYKADTSSDPVMMSYQLPDGVEADITEMVLGQDSAIWFTAYESDMIGRVNLDGQFEVFSLEDGTKPLGITNDDAGNIWFAGWGSYQLGKVDLAGGISLLDLDSQLYRPAEIVRDPDGNLWFTYDIGTRVSRFNPLTEQIEHYSITTSSNAFMDLRVGADGKIYLLGTHGVGCFEIATTGPENYAELLFTEPVFEGLGRSQITAGPDAYMYFTRLDEDKVYRVESAGADLRDLQINVNRMTDYVLKMGDFYTTIDITNWSLQTAVDLKLTIDMGEYIQFTNIEGIPDIDCVQNGTIVECALGDIAASTTKTFHINYAVQNPSLTDTQHTIVYKVDLSAGDYFPENNRVETTFDILSAFEYFNDFSVEAEDNLWSHTDIVSVTTTLDYLGYFSNDNVTLAFDKLPGHDSVHTCFQLYVNGDWDGDQFTDPENPEAVVGPDIWAHYIDENAVVLTTFSNQYQYTQAYPEKYREGSFPAQKGARAIGDFDGDGLQDDARYDFCFTHEHQAETLKLTFYGVNLTPEECEIWGIDDVSVEIYYHDAFQWLYLPLIMR